jgi:hypothetical protein
MNCTDFEPFLFAFVDGEFDGPEKADAEAHLAGCEACRREVEAQRAFKRRLREAACAQVAPAGFRERIGAALEKEALPRPIPFFRRPAFVVPVSLAAAAGIAAVIWFAAGPNPLGSEIIAAAAIDHHTHELPDDVRADKPGEMQAFLHRTVAFAPRPPQLRMPLRGLRVSSLPNGRPAVLMRYGMPDASARRVSALAVDAPDLRLRDTRHIGDRDVMIANRAGYNVVIWKEGEIAYTVVADPDEDDLGSVLELVKPAPKPVEPVELIKPAGSAPKVPFVPACWPGR